MKNKILFAVSLLFGFIFIGSGLNKIFMFAPPPDDLPEDIRKVMDALFTIGWLMPLVAIMEIVGGILFIIPKTRALGAIVIFPIMVGIVLAHIVNIPMGLPVAIALMLINLWVIFENREKYLPMIR